MNLWIDWYEVFAHLQGSSGSVETSAQRTATMLASLSQPIFREGKIGRIFVAHRGVLLMCFVRLQETLGKAVRHRAKQNGDYRFIRFFLSPESGE